MFGFMKPNAGADVAGAIAQAARGELTLVDVREPGEVAMSGRAKGALHIPLMRLPMMGDPRHPDFHAGLDPEKPVAIYCASGARSAQGKALLERFGFTDVTNLGGLHDWMAAGGAVER